MAFLFWIAAVMVSAWLILRHKTLPRWVVLTTSCRAVWGAIDSMLQQHVEWCCTMIGAARETVLHGID